MAEDLEWINLENKARKLIKELVEPTIRRAIEDREQLSKVARETEHHRSKMDEFEFSLHKIHKKLAIIDDVNKRQTDLEGAQRALDTRLVQQTQTLKADTEALAMDIQHKAETIRTFEKQLDHSASQLRVFNESLLKIRSELQADLETVQSRVLAAVEDSKAAVADVKEMLGALETQQARVNVQLGDVGAEATAHTKVIAALRAKTDKLELEKAPVSSVLDLKKELEKLHLKMLGDKENVERRLKLLKDSVISQGPYPQQLLVTDWLHEVLDSRFLRKLTEVETSRYNAWLELDTLHYDLRPGIEAALQRALTVQEQLLAGSRDLDESTGKRARRGQRDSDSMKQRGSDESGDMVHELVPKARKPSKESFARSRRSESDRSGSPDDALRSREELIPTPQFRQERRISVLKPTPPSQEHATAYQRKSRLDSAKLEGDAIPRADTAKSSVFSAQGQDFIAFYTDDSEDSQREDPAAVEELRVQVEELSQRLSTELAVMRDELAGKHEETLKQVRESAEMCSSLAQQVLAESASLTNLRKRDKADIGSDLNALKAAQQSLKTEVAAVTATSERFAQLFTHLIECCRIGLALSCQDEDDRQSIALMGYKENRPQSRPGSALKPPVMSVDKQCMSCAGQASVVLSAFKMACLAYTPSPISYRKAIFQRRELLEIQSRVLEAAWDEASTSEPWITIKLHDTIEVMPKSVRSSQMQRTFIDSEEPEEKRAMTAAPPERLPLLTSKPGSVAARRK